MKQIKTIVLLSGVCMLLIVPFSTTHAWFGGGTSERKANYSSRTSAFSAGSSRISANSSAFGNSAFNSSVSVGQLYSYSWNGSGGITATPTGRYGYSVSSGSWSGSRGGSSCVANAGQSCNSAANTCGSRNSGTRTCGGTCSASRPSNPSYLGDSCGSVTNICGMQNTGTLQCGRRCSVSTDTPPDSECPLPPFVSEDPYEEPELSTIPGTGGSETGVDLDDPEYVEQIGSCSDQAGNPCGYENASCGLESTGYLGCNSDCQAPMIPDEYCEVPGQKVTCSSRPNSCGQVNTVEIYGDSQDDCPVVAVPSQSSCGIPTLGLRTKDGRHLVQEGGTKTLVWDDVIHATQCVLSGGGLNIEITDYETDATQDPWVNTVAGDEVVTNSIDSRTTYTLRCRNGEGPWVFNSLEIVPLPEIEER